MTKPTEPSRALAPVANRLATGLFGPPNESTPTAYRYRFELERSGYVHERTELIPMAAVDKIIAELEPLCHPVAPERLLVHITQTLGCFHDKSLASPEILIRGFVEELADYPDDVIEDMARRLRRTSKFMPTIAAAIEIANRLLGPRGGALRVALAMRAEHQRRDVAVADSTTTPHGENILAAG